MNVKDVNITAYNDVVLNMLKDKEHLLNDPEQIEMILLETPIKVVHVNGIAKSITLAWMLMFNPCIRVYDNGKA